MRCLNNLSYAKENEARLRWGVRNDVVCVNETLIAKRGAVKMIRKKQMCFPLEKSLHSPVLKQNEG